MNATPRLSLNFLSTAQAQKEFLINENGQILDALVAGAVEEGPRNDPPGSPSLSDCYIIGTAPTGQWAGAPNGVGIYGSGVWLVMSAVEGMSFLIKANGVCATFRSGAWRIGEVEAASLRIEGKPVVGPRVAAIASPAGGSTVDTEARASIGQILAALRQHGLIET